MSDFDITFSGHDWENLNRLVALSRFKFTIDGDFWTDGPNDTRVPHHAPRCAFLASQFEGPALDWVASVHTSNPAVFNDFEGFITAVREGFGVADDNIKALCQTKLANWTLGTDVPVFFAELDRLFLALGITGHDTRIAHVTAKLPASIKSSLADQGRMFHNYDTMREFLITRWALGAGSTASSSQTAPKKKKKCSHCGKKGHVASECRKTKN
jgi:hypothetical protein